MYKYIVRIVIKVRQNMKQNRRIIAMLLLLLLSSIVMSGAERKYHRLEREQCFENLKEYTEQIGNEIQKNYNKERAYLEKVAANFAAADLEDDRMLGDFLRLLEGNGLISEAQLLLPDDLVLTQQGEKRDVSGMISFVDEAEKGSCLSKRMQDPLDPERMILRLQVPVIQNGETAALLWGIMDLEDFPGMFTLEAYGEAMQLYVVEGSTRNFLLDTWHDELTNMDSLSTRKAGKGYSQEQILSDFSSQKAGTTVFLSQKAEEFFYSYYCPIDVEDWMVMITLPESVVFSHAEKMHQSQMRIMGTMLVIFLVYGIWLLYDVKMEKSMNEKQLRRVRYLLDVEKELFSAFIEPSHFINGLKVIAEYATGEIAFFWVNRENQANGCRVWSNSENEWIPDVDPVECFPGIFSMLKKEGSLLTYDAVSFFDQYPAEAKKLSQNGIRNMMLILVRRLNGEETGVLGVCNMAYHWKDTELLEQISLTFSMTLEHYENYQDLIRMGNVDSLSGLLNRNSYHAALEHMEKEAQGSVACVYIDANGLHEINNKLGHQAGDEMLKTVADVLSECFEKDRTYRIGGDEFVVLCQNRERAYVCGQANAARTKIRQKGYEISFGIGWQESTQNISDVINAAEAAMQKDKVQYYKDNGGERQERMLDLEQERIISQKQDMDAFLEVLAPRFKGVYFVNLKEDSIRYIFIPDYFKRMLKESSGKFSKAILLYVREFVEEQYAPFFQKVCNYEYLERQLGRGQFPEFLYYKKDGAQMSLQILKFETDQEKSQETLWIFTELGQ